MIQDQRSISQDRLIHLVKVETISFAHSALA